jgi:hypothetical protein
MYEVKNQISKATFEELCSLGVIDEVGLRNLVIKENYKKLRKSLSMFESIAELSSLFNRSESAINSILFRKRIKKSVGIFVTSSTSI